MVEAQQKLKPFKKLEIVLRKGSYGARSSEEAKKIIEVLADYWDEL